MPTSLGNFIARPGIGRSVRYLNGSALDARRANLTMVKRHCRSSLEDRQRFRVLRQAEFDARSAEAMRRAAEISPV
jgi:hypothetical protein